MKNRLILLVVLVMLTFSLASCKGIDETLVLAVANNPIGDEEIFDKLVFTHDEGDDIVFKGDNGLSYWKIVKGGEAELITFESSLPSNVEENTDGVQTYTFGVDEAISSSFQVYVMPEVLQGSETDIVMIAFRFEKDNVLYQIGESFDPTGMMIYVVTRNGDVTVLKGEDVKNQFSDDHNPVEGDSFANKVSYTVTFTHQGFSETFEVFVSGGERPISTIDANFFDRILIIPVAFLMSFFGGLVGNSFGVAILFTTLVIRTLAWPIYAKSNDLSIKMNIAQPDMQRVQAKYATRTDPQSKQKMQMEMQQVYKKHKINLLGCFFPILQMPIFIAMFGVVRRITLEGGMYVESVSETVFLGINLDRGQDGVIGLVLAGVVGVTMFGFQKITMKKPSYAKNTSSHNVSAKTEQTQKTMKYVSYFMVVMMAFYAYQNNALAVYWIFGNIYSLVQTMFNRKINEKKHYALENKQLTG